MDHIQLEEVLFGRYSSLNGENTSTATESSNTSAACATFPLKVQLLPGSAEKLPPSPENRIRPEMR